MDWSKFAWLKRGKRRIDILRILNNSTQPITINEIKLTSKIAISQASATVSELLDKGLIRCKNPDDKIGKLFEINEEGKKFLQLLNKEKNGRNYKNR